MQPVAGDGGAVPHAGPRGLEAAEEPGSARHRGILEGGPNWPMWYMIPV